MKFTWFHEIHQISPWNPPDFTMKSARFHEYWTFVFILQNQYRYTVWSTTECCIFYQNQSPWHEIWRISWNLVDFMAMKSARLHAWNLPDFTMKSAGFHGIPLNAVFFIRTNTDIHCRSPCHEIHWISCMKSARFHEIHLLSWNPLNFTMKSTRFHGIPLNAVFFIRTNTDIHCISPCHEIHQISCMKSAGFNEIHPKWAKDPWSYFWLI